MKYFFSRCFHLHKFGPQNRSFNAKYYSEFEWLEYSVSRDAVFCFNCINFAKNLKTDILITTGYKNWRKVCFLFEYLFIKVKSNYCLEIIGITITCSIEVK